MGFYVVVWVASAGGFLLRLFGLDFLKNYYFVGFILLLVLVFFILRLGI